jgi:hypothetical protein
VQDEKNSLGFGKHLGIVYVNLEHREFRGRKIGLCCLFSFFMVGGWCRTEQLTATDRLE